MSSGPVHTKAEALKILRDADLSVSALLDQLPPRTFTTPGIGGGGWSSKDLIAHLAFWEVSALEAMDAWEGGDRAPIDVALRSTTLHLANQEGLVRMSKGSAATANQRAVQVHDQLLGRIRSMPTRRWNSPPTPRGRRPLGVRIGAILGGPGGPFMHANAHLSDLTAFVEQYGQGGTPGAQR